MRYDFARKIIKNSSEITKSFLKSTEITFWTYFIIIRQLLETTGFCASGRVGALRKRRCEVQTQSELGGDSSATS